MRLTNEILEIAQIKQPSTWLDILNIELERNKITHPADVACFLAQCSYESKGFSALQENMNYTPNKLVEIFKTRNGLTYEKAKELCQDGWRAVADFVYGLEWGRKYLSNTDIHDGSRYIGRGIIQLTGKYNYTYFGKKTGLNIVEVPELAASPKYAAKLAMAYWVDKKCQKYAISENCDKVTEIITGKKVGTDPEDKYGFKKRENLFRNILKSI